MPHLVSRNILDYCNVNGEKCISAFQKVHMESSSQAEKEQLFEPGIIQKPFRNFCSHTVKTLCEAVAPAGSSALRGGGQWEEGGGENILFCKCFVSVDQKSAA